jgi:PAS domain S-box-containing protein
MMNWAVVGLVYAGAYAALMTVLADAGSTRTLVGNIGLLLPPFSLMIALVRRRADWQGRQAVFWGAIGAWAILWFVGQVVWASDELFQATLLPWFRWPILLQLCASALPLIALVAWPHRGVFAETTMTAALDIAVLLFLTGFLYWSLIIAPGMDPVHRAFALRSLATIGPLVRLAAVIGLLSAAASAGNGAWATVYQRIAFGMLGAFVVLITMSLSAVRGDYATGSPADIGWMLPFFFAAWAASTAPVSPHDSRRPRAWGTQPSSPALIFIALLAVPIIGYGSIAVTPLGGEIDRLRERATVFTLVAGIALVMLRLRVERFAAEQANQRARLLATACEQAGELIIIISRDSHIEYANEAFCRASGYSHEELKSLPPASLVAPESADAIPGFNDSIRARKVTRVTLALARKDGTTFQTACAAAPILDGAGRVTHFVAVIRDITEDLHLRGQLVRSERLSAIGEFVSGVAHEINNPLQSIIGTLELVLDQSHEPALRADLERTHFEAGRAGRIVRNLLTFVRQSPNERVLIDINETVKATVAIRSYELELAGIQMTEEYAPGLPLVLANRDEIQQVLLNLVINAQQAIAESDGQRVLSVRTHLIRGDAVVDVCDTGPGVPEAIAGKIFEPFFTTRTAGVATGLGLSMSLGIAHAHHGDLELVPSPSGSCFRLTLPGAGFPGPAVVHSPSPVGPLGTP